MARRTSHLLYLKDEENNRITRLMVKRTKPWRPTFENWAMFMYIDGRDGATTEFMKECGVDLDRCIAVNCDPIINPIMEECNVLTSSIETATSEKDGIWNVSGGINHRI